MKKPKGSEEPQKEKPDSVFLNRKKLVIEPGAIVEHDGGAFRIEAVVDLERIIGNNLNTGRTAILNINELNSLIDTSKTVLEVSAQDLTEVADKDWEVALYRYHLIKPFLVGRISKAAVKVVAENNGVNYVTVYRWIKRYKGVGSMTGLMPARRGTIPGTKKLPEAVEAIIQQVIQDTFLTKERPSVTHVAREVKRRCVEQGIKTIPNRNTVESRIYEIHERSRLSARGFKEKAKNKFHPVPGTFPNADYPLAVVQIDHTPVDLIVVDEEHRQPIGRPNLTLAIDVYSRMVVGYYLSLDPINETAVAMCVAQSILPKAEWLLLHNVEATWEACGFPTLILTDNAAEFKSGNFKAACDAHGINLEFRRKATPRDGGHIERLIGTFLREIHVIPGTTFSNIKDREGYDSEKESVMTLAEFERWFVIQICTLYHRRPHKELGMTPARKWEIGVHGHGLIPGHGLPKLPGDRRALLLDFLPAERRTIQHDGVSINNCRYYSDVLRTWVNAPDPDDRDQKRKFVFRYDPRNISSIWWLCPDDQRYYQIPFANQARPELSLWEHQRVQEYLKKQGLSPSDEQEQIRGLTAMRQIVAESKAKTKKARLQSERQKHHQKGVTPANPLAMPEAQSDSSENDQMTWGDVTPFDE